MEYENKKKGPPFVLSILYDKIVLVDSIRLKMEEPLEYLPLEVLLF